jgi:hypothetical protein
MSTAFKYELTPYGAVRGEDFTFTLAVTNPAEGKLESDILIYVKFDQNLTPQPEQVNPTSVSNDWNASPQSTPSGTIFALHPNASVTFKPGETRQFKFSNTQVTDNASDSEVMLIEQVDGYSENHTIKVPKLEPVLGIIGYANPVKVGKGQSTTLFFTSNVATKIIIEPIGKTIFTSDQGNGQSFSDKVEVSPPLQDGKVYNQLYALTAYNEAGEFVPINVVVFIEPPQIDTFTASPASDVSIDDDDAVTISWTTQYSNVTYLQPQFGNLIQVLSNDSHTFSGEALKVLLKNSPNQDTLNFTLTVDNNHGYRFSSQPLTIKLSKAQILYFKYRTRDEDGLKNPTFAAANDVTNQYQPDSTLNGGTYTIEGPGGPLSQKLGSQYDTPQIMYFSPDKETIHAGDEVTLDWTVHNIDKMNLKPGGVSAPIDKDGNGKLTVTVDEDITYTLVSSNGVTSTLALKVS